MLPAGYATEVEGMRVVRYHEHGGPEVLRCEEAPQPLPGRGEVLVRVRACGINHVDLRNRSAQGAGRIALPRIPGADIAGEVAAWGEGVDARALGLEEGKAVLVHPAVSCGRCPACLAGRENACPEVAVFGWHRDGGCADYVSVPAEAVMPYPPGLGFAEAAAFPLVFLTAWHMLVARARVAPGETVLVLGAAGGVGSAAVQIAFLLGARVLATVSDGAKAGRVAALGAERVIIPSHEDVAAVVREATGGWGVDVVVDHAGQATWETALLCLARSGRMVNCGATTGTAIAFDLREFYRRQLSLLGSFLGTRAEMRRIISLVAAGRLRPVLDRTFPLAEAAAAHRYVEERRHFGKVVLVT